MNGSLKRLWLCLSIALMWANYAHGEEFNITAADSQITATTLSVNATLDLSLNSTVIEAIHNGVPVVLTNQVDMYQVRQYWRDPLLAEWSFENHLSYHSLSNRYLLTQHPAGNFSSFDTLEEVLNQIEDFHFTTQLSPDNLPPSKHGYRFTMRFVLNIGKLPSPLQTVALFSRDWRLKTPYYRWRSPK